MSKVFTRPYGALIHFLRILTRSWHFKVFLINISILLILGSFNNYLQVDQIPNTGDSVLYVLIVWMIKSPLMNFSVLPSITMSEYAGIPLLGAGPLIPFLPVVLLAIFTGEIFAYKLLSLVLLAIAAGVMSYYTYYFVHSRIASFVAAIVYVWNPPMLLTAVSEGHFDVTWVFPIIPLVFLTTLAAIKKSTPRNLALASLFFCLLMLGQAQALLLIGPFYLIFILLLGILPSLRSSGNLRRMSYKLAGRIGALGVIILLGFSLVAFRVLPLIFDSPYRHSDVLSGVIDYGLLAAFSAQNIFAALTLRVPSGHGEPFLHDPLGAGPLYAVFAASIPVIAILAFILDRRNKVTKINFLLMVLAAFVTLGPLAPPFFQPFMWLIQFIPFYGEIRTPGRFSIMTAFFIAFLCGVGVKKISDRLSKSAAEISAPPRIRGSLRLTKRLRIPKSLNKREITKLYAAGLLSMFLILSAAPALTSSFVTYDFPPELMGAYQTIGQQAGNFRFIGLPAASYYPQYVYGLSTSPDCYAPIITGKANLFGTGSGASYNLVNFLYYYVNSIIASNISYSIGKLLGLYNVKWIILHQPMLYNHTVQGLLQDPTLRVLYSSGDNAHTVVEEIQEPYPLIYSAHNMLLLGGPESILALAGLDRFSLSSPAKWAFAIPNQFSPFKLAEGYMAKFDAICFRESDLTSAASLEYGMSAATLFSSNIFSSKGWVRDYFYAGGRWIPPHNNGSGVKLDKSASSLYGSYIETTVNETAYLKFDFNAGNGGEYEFWTRTWFPNDFSNFSLTVDESMPTAQNLSIPNERWSFGWHWINGGTCNVSSGTHSLTLRKTGTGIYSFDAFLIIAKGTLNNYISRFANLLEGSSLSTIYVLDAHTSFKSADSSWIQSLALGGNTSTGRCLSASSNGAEANATVFVPKSGNYSLSIRLLQRQNRANLSLYMDGLKMLDFKPQGEDKWVTRIVNSSIYLYQGYHNFTISNNGVLGNEVDKLIISHTSNGIDLLSPLEEASEIVHNFNETSPARYVASIELSKPSLVVFNAAFHPGWHAFDGESEYEPVLVNYFVNGFYINSTGKITLTIVFGLDPPRIIGSYLSILAASLIVALIIYGKYGKQMKQLIKRK